MPAPACWDLHGELNSTLNAGADRALRPVDPAPWVWSGHGQVSSGTHCKTVETTVETISLITVRLSVAATNISTRCADFKDEYGLYV